MPVPASTFRLSHMVLWLVPLVWLWGVLISDLHVEWSVNSQYGYGWAVPFLCLYLLWQRFSQPRGEVRSEVSSHPPSSVFHLLVALAALLYVPTRLIQEANPGWRLTSWALALEVITITLCWLRFTVPSWRTLLFPICFFLVAVPWPTPVEAPLIQGFTRVDATATCEFLGLLGVPAMPHGNVIEVATGTVGIDEACSGIRSFQATLMISLFLGEFYRLSLGRRVALCLSGFGLSLVFNLARMSLLVWVAAHEGVSAIAKWHDPAGVTILLGCFFGLWGIGAWLGRSSTKSAAPDAVATPSSLAILKPVVSVAVPAVLAGWLVLSESAIETWYRVHEARLPLATPWTLQLPTNNPTCRAFPLAARTREILRFDENRSATWQDGNTAWQAVFLRWNPGRTALHLAQNHTPEVCMTAAGHTLTVVAAQQWFVLGDTNSSGPQLKLPFAIYEVQDGAQPYYVFYCLWDDRASTQGFTTMDLDYGNRITPVLAGLRNPGQRSLEVAVIGPDNAAAAEEALRRMLNRQLVWRR